MSEKHTPGPWEYDEHTKTIRSMPSNYWLASMNSWDGVPDHAANARLIAAAPRLLEATQIASQILKDPLVGSKVLALDVLQAAITQATGPAGESE